MLASKRGADGITQFSIKNKRSCSYDLRGNNQGILSQLSEEVASKLSRSVVLLVLTNGCAILNQFYALAIEHRSNVTKFVTSGTLVKDLYYYGMENKNWLGAAFFDFDGKFVGMNHEIFLPSRIILEQSTSTQREAFRYVGMNDWFETKSGKHWFHPKGGWVLLNTFEDDFDNYYLKGVYPQGVGNVYPKGVWDLFRKKRFSSEISRNVVALASFRGETRFFASTGVFVDFDDKCSTILTSACLVTHPYLHNKIVEGLRIVDTEVLAIWRIFESGTLMASSGKITADTDNLDCSILWYSTCEVTKAAIGGPLVDVNGNFIGMNFIGLNKEIGTAYLYREDLRGILEYFKTKNTKCLRANGLEAVVTEDGKGPKNTWPVPEPLWCDPSKLKDRVNDKREDKANGLQTRYVGGIKFVLK